MEEREGGKVEVRRIRRRGEDREEMGRGEEY